MKKIAVLASGNGSNFEALVKAIKQKSIRATISLLITDVADSYVRKRAQRLGVKDIFIDPRSFTTRYGFDTKLVRILRQERIDLVVLAGYMRILSPVAVKAYKNRILNIHPALLPAFPGVDSIKRAHNYGVKITGVTVHLVDEKIDHGPIIAQGAVAIGTMSLEQLERKIHALEHTLYPLALKKFLEKRVVIRGRHATFF